MTVVLVITIVISLVVVWLGPKHHLKKSNLQNVDKTQLIDLENKLRQTYSQILGGMIVMIGFYISYSNFTSVKFRQDTEILSNCLSQLADSSETIRIGSIYTLDKLASYSNEDAKIVLDILCNFLSNDSNGIRGQKEANLILKIIGNRLKETDLPGNTFSISNSRFSKLELANLDFSGVNFTACEFETCIINFTAFKNSSLSGSRFTQCYMLMCNFSKAYLFNTKFASCNLQSNDFSGASLNSAMFSDCTLRESNFLESSFGTSFTPKNLGSFNDFNKGVQHYGKTKIEKSDLTDVKFLVKDTSKIFFEDNIE
jgi:uncharacterized protein YjbI with pentapeptide repeats